MAGKSCASYWIERLSHLTLLKAVVKNAKEESTRSEAVNFFKDEYVLPLMMSGPNQLPIHC